MAIHLHGPRAIVVGNKEAFNTQLFQIVQLGIEIRKKCVYKYEYLKANQKHQNKNNFWPREYVWLDEGAIKWKWFTLVSVQFRRTLIWPRRSHSNFYIDNCPFDVLSINSSPLNILMRNLLIYLMIYSS